MQFGSALVVILSEADIPPIPTSSRAVPINAGTAYKGCPLSVSHVAMGTFATSPDDSGGSPSYA
jgi:hypothetical protein